MFNNEIFVGSRRIANNEPTYIICEIGSNHNQSLSQAKEMIEIAYECGADAVKFQSLKYDQLYKKDKTPKGIEKLFEKIHLEESWYKELALHSQKVGLHFLSAPTYLNSIELLHKVGCPAFKVASPQFDLFPEITLEAAKYKKPLFMSVGISRIGDIDRMMKLCSDKNIKDIVLLHCVSQYPTPPRHANLSFIRTLSTMYNTIVGYSDHTLGTHFPVSAVALGARVIEKHFTLDKSDQGPDHYFASEPSEFKIMVNQIREIEVGIGSGEKAPLTDWESKHRQSIAMKFVASKVIKANTQFKLNDFHLLRAEGGISREHLELLVNGQIQTELKEGELLTWKNICLS
ncbi:N-acetylneuraminate synthase family protein [Pseudoalteromonas sp. SA25]|uniref:N-acetylneuraminate synthase family protein n=1 Tax=Pseudoalteromonas sp. SA25 TaxID=2686347 RepID=UPI0013FDFF56|nr:N-acetylneuraminate synthase family protein [Pseudoalteromonas sp. SA25]